MCYRPQAFVRRPFLLVKVSRSLLHRNTSTLLPRYFLPILYPTTALHLHLPPPKTFFLPLFSALPLLAACIGCVWLQKHFFFYVCVQCVIGEMWFVVLLESRIWGNGNFRRHPLLQSSPAGKNENLINSSSSIAHTLDGGRCSIQYLSMKYLLSTVPRDLLNL